MKILIATAVLMGLSISGAQAQGQKKSKKIEAKISFSAARETGEGGSNVGGTNDSIKIVTDWTDSVADQLASFHETAVMKKADGSLDLANDIYREGLEKILESASESNGRRLTWTYKTAERALQLSQRLNADQASAEAQNDVLSYFYDLIGKNYERLDASYYGRAIKRDCDMRLLDDHLQVYANELLTWFERSMLTVSTDGSIAPLYSDRVFFLVFATLTKGLSEDFGAGNSRDPSLFPTRYASLAKMLARSAKQMEGVLAGNGAYSTEPRAVQGAYNDLKKIQAELK